MRRGQVRSGEVGLGVVRQGKVRLSNKLEVLMRQRHETDIEKLLREEIESRGYKRGIDFATQYPIKNSFVLDFAFPDKKIMIEADGEPFHSSAKARQRDGFKNYIMEKKGWTVLRFWGDRIREDVKECVDVIEQYL